MRTLLFEVNGQFLSKVGDFSGTIRCVLYENGTVSKNENVN